MWNPSSLFSFNKSSVYENVKMREEVISNALFWFFQSRADLEDFWNEITTTENEEKIEDEKSFEIDVDVKEKQLEIENAIEEVLSPEQVG